MKIRGVKPKRLVRFAITKNFHSMAQSLIQPFDLKTLFMRKRDRLEIVDFEREITRRTDWEDAGPGVRRCGYRGHTNRTGYCISGECPRNRQH